MRGSDYTELTAFVAVATHKSFSRAAAHLRVSPPALSQTIRRLEERLGARLLNRTTRSVSLSEAGERLLARALPSMSELEAAVAEVRESRERPSGSLRINAPPVVATRLLGPLLGPFHAAYPDIVLDIVIEEALTDIVAGRFDAGIRLGERLEKDMIAVRLDEEQEMAAVGSPEYFARHGVPRTPRELHKHRCINWRWSANGNLYRWEFEKNGKALEVAADGPLIVNDLSLLIQGAVDGVGLAYVLEQDVRPWLEAGRLKRVLKDWSPRFPGFHLYYPSRQVSAPLRAFLDFLRK
ncbi:LysR family transcriptional regulator [Pyxidicoccus fallax]|uniref:LysR family transcriptional regulator n=1 Tax=Pyxidicoccus fallax TaxID=394095 RepID=A0A848LI77_9BACT|nr:LysR family transcriptional regulator [Pyxidicoccus fallax]NMO17415.1 LysR family transcriptional regulator [Pyxidicoccus fallax]NPC77964.1 LysR family transcriptional regulator [Pyxidicoccus fallax]